MLKGVAARGPMGTSGSSGWPKNAAGQFVGAADGWHRPEGFPPQGERPAVEAATHQMLKCLNVPISMFE